MIKITQRAWDMLMLAARHDEKLEVGGFAHTSIENGNVIIGDILIPPQEVRSTHTQIGQASKHDGPAMTEHLDWLMLCVIERGDQPLDWCTWWHSHNTMGTSPSGTDHDTAEQLAEQSAEGFAIGLIVNVFGQCTAWATLESPVDGAFIEQSLSVEVEKDYDPALIAEVEAMMENVKEKKFEYKAAPFGTYKQAKKAVKDAVAEWGTPDEWEGAYLDWRAKYGFDESDEVGWDKEYMFYG